MKNIDVVMTDEMKNKYIQGYEEEEFRNIFTKLKKYKWMLSFNPDIDENDYQVALLVFYDDGSFSEEDRLSKTFAEELMGGTFDESK